MISRSPFIGLLFSFTYAGDGSVAMTLLESTRSRVQFPTAMAEFAYGQNVNNARIFIYEHGSENYSG